MHITAVHFWSLTDVTRVAIEVSADFRYKSVRLTAPDRLFFDIQGARPGMDGKGIRSVPVGDSLLKQIRIAETQPGVTRVVLDLQQNAEFTASQLSNPDRLMVELRAKEHGGDHPPVQEPTITNTPKPVFDPEILASAPLPSLVTPAEPKKPEPRKFQPPTARVVARVEMKPELLAQPAFSLAAKPPRLPSLVVGSPVIKKDLPPPPPPPLIARLKPEPVVMLPKPEPVALKTTTARSTEPSPGEPMPAKHNASGDRSLSRVLGLKLGRVVLDPGHGAYDVGTHGPSGLTEKEVVLDVAKRLGGLLEDRLGTDVIYTRSDDTFIPLEERTKIANEHKADLFLSIHANSSPLRYAAGVETYVLNFTTSRNALDLATRENASSERSMYDLKELLQKIALRDKIDESREFASRLQTSLYSVSSKGNTAAKNRGVKKAPFVVLIGASMPSVLAEIGFLTNTADESLLRKPDHRQKIAEALYKGISNYADTLSHFQVAKRN
jgi:N-acetylmuramoyl-L-alanine amidase